MGMGRSGAEEHGENGYWAYNDTGLSAIWIEYSTEEKARRQLEKEQKQNASAIQTGPTTDAPGSAKSKSIRSHKAHR